MRPTRFRPSHPTVVAYLALFVALTGGTAAALSGSNTVQSDDIGPGAQVKAPDVADNAVGSPDVINNSLTGADIKEPTLGRLDSDQVIFAFGPLPVEGTFTSEGGELLIVAEGTGQRGSANDTDGLIAMGVKLDGTTVAHALVFAEGRSVSHSTFATHKAVQAPAGQHTIRLEELRDSSCNAGFPRPTAYCTFTDSFDTFNVSVIELP
jgi:hypothetical protein